MKLNHALAERPGAFLVATEELPLAADVAELAEMGADVVEPAPMLKT